MTCFWNGIIQHLNKEDLELINYKHNKHDIQQFIIHLKTLSQNNSFNITWQNQNLTNQEKQELKTFIQEYNIKNINQGHLTSSCDPFLCLLADTLKCKIEFNYCNHKILFQSKDQVRKTFKFKANRGHFSRV